MRTFRHSYSFLVVLSSFISFLPRVANALLSGRTPNKKSVLTPLSAATQQQQAARLEIRQRVQDLISSRDDEYNLQDAMLGRALDELISSNNSNKSFDPKAVVGTWRVVHAPHLAFLSKLVACRFCPIEYHLQHATTTPSWLKNDETKTTPQQQQPKIASSVRYQSKLFGAGWLNTAGTYRVEKGTGNVIIVWDTVWWNIGEDVDRPTWPKQGDFPEIIQTLGQIGFIEPLSFFPIKFVDEDLAVFRFFGFTITAAKQQLPVSSNDDDGDGIYRDP